MLVDTLRQGGLCLTGFFAAAAFTVISPFYPAAAERQGIPSYLVGFIFSSFPAAGLIFSAFLPAIMLKLGRTPVLLLGVLLIAFSNILISFLESSPTPIAIAISFGSRIISGLGAACNNISITTTLSSDYPTKISALIALNEVCSGLGVIVGPAVGSLFYSYGGFKASCRNIGFVLIAWIPLLYLVVGKSRPYVITEKQKIDMKELVKKRIFLNAVMPFSVMLGIGVILPTLEFHMLSYDINEADIGLWYLIYTTGYIVGSIIMMFPNKISKPKIMCFGMFLIGLGYFFLGPSPLVMSRNIIAMAIGLHLIGWSFTFIYIPSIPYMIEVAQNEYGYEKDDRLNDSISGIVNVGLSLGEIIGPIFGAYSVYLFSYEMFYTLVAGIFFAYAVYYIFASGLNSKARKVSSVLETALVDINPNS